MDEIEKMYQSGIISAETYQKLKQKQVSNTIADETNKNLQSLGDYNKFVTTEQNRGLGNVDLGGSTSGDIFMDQEELDTYTSRGINPTEGVDYENIRAERQTWQDQLANGVIKAVGKTATAVGGGLAMLPSFAIVTLGQLTDGLLNQDNVEWKSVFDNDFQKAMDAANESMDKALPNYVSNAQREASALASMGTMNFWANDVLQGASFIAGALITEGLTAGMATGATLTRAAKFLKGLSTADDMASIAGKANQFSKLATADRLLKVGRQMITGAAYEAGVEARGFVDQAKNQFISNYIEQNGVEPSEEEVAAAMNDINEVGNYVFATNLALVSLGNMVTLPKTFAPGLASKFGYKAGKHAEADWLVKPSELTDTQLGRIAKKTGKSIDDIKAEKLVNKWDALSKTERLARTAKGRFGTMATEGFFEEGLQGVTQNAALDYISNKYNPDNIYEVNSVTDSVIRGFEEQYGLDNAEGWKEIIIGSILGGIGAPNIGRKSKDESIWQGGVLGYKNPTKRASVQGLMDQAIKYGGMTPDVVKHATTISGTSKKQQQAETEGDMFEAKNQEYASMYSYVSTMIKLGRFDEIDSEVGKMVEKMTPDEFAQAFDYTNLTEQELTQRKSEVLKSFKDRASDIREAYKTADRIAIYEDDADLKDGLGYVLGIAKNIDYREDKMFKQLQDKLGKIYSNQEVKQMASYVNFQRTTDAKELKEYDDKQRELVKKQGELEKLTQYELKANKNKTSSQIMERDKKLDSLENEISILENAINGIEERLNKQYTEYLKAAGILDKGGESIEYTKDKKAFKQDYDLFRRVQKDITDTVGEDFYNRPDIKPLFDDLMKLASYRQQQITLANYYMTNKGQARLSEEAKKFKGYLEEELISDELERVRQENEKQSLVNKKMQDVAAEAYRLTAQRVHGTAYVIKEHTNVKNDLKEVIDSIEDDQVGLLVQAYLEQLEGIDVAFTVSQDEAIKKEAAQKGLELLDLVNTILQESKSKMTQQQVKDADAIINSTKLKEYKDKYTKYLKSSKPETNTSTNPRMGDPSRLVVMLQDYIDQEGKELLNSKSVDDIIENLSLRVLELPDNGMINLEDTNKNKFDDQVMLQRGLVGMPTFGIQIVYDGVHIGNITDPDKFRFKDANGDYVDFNLNDPVDHLELLNAEYVTIDTDGKKVSSQSGKYFLDYYKNAKPTFEKIKEQIQAGKREFSPSETKQLFDVQAIFTGLSKDLQSNTTPLSQWESLNNDNLKTNFSDFGGEGTGLLIFNKLKGEITFYKYNTDTKELSKISDPEQIEKITNRFYSGDAQDDVNHIPGSVKILYYSQDHIKGIKLQQPDFPVEYNIADKLISKMIENTQLIRQEHESRNEGNTFKIVEGWETNKDMFFSALNTNKNISLSVTGMSTEKGSTNVKGSALVLKITTNKSDTKITLCSTDPNDHNAEMSGFNFKNLKDGTTVLTYNKQIIKDNIDLITALNKYIKEKAKAGLDKENDTTIKEKSNYRKFLNLLTDKIVDGNHVREPIQILKIYKNYDEKNLQESINDFIPLRSPTATYLFKGKPQSVKSTSFQNLITNFPTTIKNAIKGGLPKLEELRNRISMEFNLLTQDNMIKHQSDYEKMINRVDTEINYKKKSGTTEEPITEPQTEEKPTATQGESVARILEGFGMSISKSKTKSENKSETPIDEFLFASQDKSNITFDITEVKERLSKILPDSILVKPLEELTDSLANGAITYGVFKNSVIYLAKANIKGVEYHEAFHAVFRSFLTPAQVSKVLSEAVERYGKPTSKQLDELRSLNNNYAKLSTKQLTDLWYEEKLADSFMDLMNNEPVVKKEKSFLDKILDLIKSIVNFFSKKETSEIDALFNNIQKGKFKNAKQINPSSDLSLFSTIKYTSSLDNKTSITRFHDGTVTNNILNKVFFKSYNVFKNQGYLTDTDIKNSITGVAQDYVGILKEVIFDNKFKRYDSGLHDPNQDAIRLKNIIKSIYRFQEPTEELQQKADLIREENIKTIIKDVRQYIDTVKFTDNDLESEEAEDDSPTEIAQKPNQRIGGLSSVSKEFKKYIMFTELPIDEFDLGIPKDVLETDPKYKNYVNGIKLYNSLERMLVNTERRDLLKKLSYIKEGQPQLQAFYKRLVEDIYSELGLPLVGDYLNDITEFTINQLKASSKFNLLCSALTKHKIESVINIADTKSGDSKVFISNVNDARKVQREVWYSNWKRMNLDNKTSFVLEKLNLINNYFNTEEGKTEKADYILRTNLNDLTLKIKTSFDEIGITLSDKYIQLSLVKIIKDTYPQLEIDQDSQLKMLNEIYTSYKDVDYITSENIVGIINSISVDGNPYINKSELQKLVNNSVNISDQEEDALGAKGRINNIANGNALFDESVSPSTVRNVNNEMVYIHLYPNYISSLLLKIRNDYQSLLNAVDADTFEDGMEIFRTFLNNNNLYIEGADINQLVENYFRILYTNPFLTDKHLNGELRINLLKNLNAYLLDGLKQQSIDDEGNIQSFKGSKASQYSALDKKGKFIMMLNLFAKTERNSLAKNVVVGNEDFSTYPVIAFQNEGKNTQYAFNVLNRNFVDSNGKPSALALEYFTKIFNTEAANIKAEYDRMLTGEGNIEGFNEIKPIRIEDKTYSKSEIIDILKNPNNDLFFKVVSKYRALSFVEFDFIKTIDTLVYEGLIKSIVTNQQIDNLPALITDAIEISFENFIKEIASLDTGLIVKNKDGGYENILLPKYYIDANRQIDMNKLKQFYFNNWLNSSLINSLIFGNINTGLKNSIDLSKRYAGPNAVGPALGFDNLNFAVVEDIKYDYLNPSTKEVKSNNDRTDAQSYGTIDWYYNNYLKTFSKINPEVDRIYRKIRMMIPINSQDKEILENYGALLNPRKTSLFNTFVYGKTSTDVLDRNEISYVPKDKLTEFRKDISKLLDIKDSVEYNNFLVNTIQPYYQPYPNTVKLHEMLNKMEKQSVDVVFFKSAIKTNKENVTQWDDELKPMKVSNEFFREQVITDNLKQEIIHGTQMMNLIYSEQNNDTEVSFKGNTYKVGTLKNMYRQLLGDRLYKSYNTLRKAVFNQDGSANYKALLISFKQSLIEQGGDPTLLELFDGMDQPTYNLNLPRILSMYENMFLAFMGKGTFQQKVPGHKFTLVSDYGHEIMEQNGSIITQDQYKENPSLYKNITVRPLEFKYDNIKQCWFGECKIPLQIAELLQLKKGDNIPQEFLEMVGIRIPTQDKHSMIYLKVVDILPPQKGNKIIMPKEVLTMSGADFDIDSEFVRTVSYYTNTDSQGKTHINIYGSYLQEPDADKRIGKAYHDFRDELITSKEIKLNLKDAKANSSEYLAITSQIDNVNFNIKELRKELKNLKDSARMESILDDVLSNEEFSFGSILKSVQQFLEDTPPSYKQVKEDIKAFVEEKKELLNIKKQITKELENKILKSKGYPLNLESFKAYRLNGIPVLDIINDNYNNYNKINDGNITNYKPITIGEINNLLLEIEKVLINNNGNHVIAGTPASRDAAEDFIKKYYNKGIFKDPVNIVEYSTPTAIVKISDANALGAQNIGISAVGNVIFQFLKSNNTLIENLGITLDSYTNEDGERINNLISTIISMAVDNAKEQDAARFNVTPATQGSFIFMVMSKIPFEKVGLIHLQESVINYAQLQAAIDSPIQSDELSDTDKLLTQYEEGYNKEEVQAELGGELTIDHLVEAKKYSQNKETSTLTENQFKYINYLALKQVMDFSAISQKSTGFSRFVSLIKGLNTELADVNNIVNKLESIGLEIVKLKDSTGNNLNDYSIRHTNKYVKYVNYVRQAGLPNELYPIDYLPIIQNDGLLTNQVKALGLFLKDSSKFFIAQTPKALNLISQLEENLKIGYLNKKDNYNKIVKLLTSYYGVKAGENLANVQFDYDQMVKEFNSDQAPLLINLLVELRKNPTLANNKFLNILDYELIPYDDKSKAGFKNRKVYPVITNSFIRLSPEEQRRITSDYELLLQPDFITTDPQLKEQIKSFTTLLKLHIQMKDLGMYRNKSFIGFLPPSFFTGISNSLNKVQKVLEGNGNFEEVFGVSEKEFNKEFIERYSRDINNTFALKSQKADIVFGLIRSSYLNFLTNLNDADVAMLTKDKSKLGELLIKLSNIRKLNNTANEDSNDDIKLIFKTLQGSGLYPLKYTSKDKDDPKSKATVEVSIYSNIGKPKEELDSVMFNPVVVNANIEALKSTLLFPTDIIKDGKNFREEIIFPDFIIFNFQTKEGQSNYKLLKRVNKIRGKNQMSKKENAGIYAKYEEVSRIGSKQVLPYVGSLKQLESYAEGLLTEYQEPLPEEVTKRKTYSGKVTNLQSNQIFVFGSNEGSSKGGLPTHGAGAAKLAKDNYGAIQGQSRGLQGQSYAIVTKKFYDIKKSSTPQEIINEIKRLYEFANQNPTKEFLVSDYSESNLNGYTGQEMANMFNAAGPIPFNIVFNENFNKLVNTTQAPISDVKPVDVKQALANLKKLMEINKIKGYSTGTDIFTGKQTQTPIYESYPIDSNRVKTIKDFLNTLNLTSELQSYVNGLTESYLKEFENRSKLLDKITEHLENPVKESINTESPIVSGNTDYKNMTLDEITALYEANKVKFKNHMVDSVKELIDVFKDSSSSNDVIAHLIENCLK